jgi:hypothetical protein
LFRNLTYWAVVSALEILFRNLALAAILSGNPDVKRDYRPPVEGVARVYASLGAAESLTQRLRKRRTSILREEVAWTASGPDEIDEKTYALCTALIASKGRLGL